MTRAEVVGQLWTGILNVTFTKKDGTERTITGTQDPMRIPFHKYPTSIDEATPSSPEGSACRVYDMDMKEWRSFCWDAVKMITSSNGQVWYDATRDGGLK